MVIQTVYIIEGIMRSKPFIPPLVKHVMNTCHSYTIKKIEFFDILPKRITFLHAKGGQQVFAFTTFPDNVILVGKRLMVDEHVTLTSMASCQIIFIQKRVCFGGPATLRVVLLMLFFWRSGLAVLASSAGKSLGC